MSDVTTCPRCGHSLTDSRVSRRVVVCRRCTLRLDDSAGRGADVLGWVFGGLVALGVLAVVFLCFQPGGAYERNVVLLIGFGLAFAYLDAALMLTLGRYLLRWWRTWSKGSDTAAALLFLVLLPGLVGGVVGTSFVVCCGILYAKGVQ